MTRSLAILFLALLAMPAIPAFAWGNEGHQIVARLAAKRIFSDKTVRDKIVALLKQDPQIELSDDPTLSEFEAAMAHAATWPDHIDKTATHTGNWHFLDLAINDGPSAVSTRCVDENCITAKVKTLRANLKANKKLGQWEVFEELKFLIHFLGDIHQPLHAATNADAGGNCLTTDGTNHGKLHQVWDDDLVDEVRKGPGNAFRSDSRVAADLNTLVGQHPEWMTTLKEDAILMESHALAVSDAYGKLSPKVKAQKFKIVPVSTCKGSPGFSRTIQPAYVSAETEVVRQQLAKAGARLAAILAEAFGS